MTCNGPDISETCATPEDAPGQELDKECFRLQTFSSFPSHCPVSFSALARAGFFYTGERDKVKCFSCHAVVEGWKHGDSAIGRHKIVSPNCKFMNGINVWTNDTHSVLPNCLRRTENCSPDPSPHPPLDPSSDLCADYLLRSGQVVDLSDTLYPRNPAMCREDTRLRSFHNWPAYAPITPKELAHAGLYYTGIDDQVECFCCGGKLRNWEPCDQAWSEHRRHFPRCFFVLGHDVGNVGSVPNHSGDAELHTSDVRNASIPQNPSMADYEARIKTFMAWRYSVSKEQLARAGFYSIGNGDHVVCFHCGGGLQEWKENEDPWQQHAQWFPGCKYLVEERGQDFVNSVQLKSIQLENSTVEVAEKTSLINDEELLQNHLIQDAMHMGFSLDEIRKTLARKHHMSAQHYKSVEALITDLISAQSDNVSWESTVPKDLSTEEKLRRLQDEKLCKICMDKAISVVLIPCGHLVTCKSCAEAVDKCPVCCATIANRQKIYMY